MYTHLRFSNIIVDEKLFGVYVRLFYVDNVKKLWSKKIELMKNHQLYPKNQIL